jgi:quinone-modifying oxidoreductase, subunit QmoC
MEETVEQTQQTPATTSSGAADSPPVSIEPDMEFIRQMQKMGGESYKKCFQCATCSGTCPISPDSDPFPRKEMIWAVWGLKDKLVTDADIWLCHQCNDCSTQCPRGSQPGDVIAVVRNLAFQHYAFPGFMGKLVASPKALPLLLSIPIVLILGLISAFGTWDPTHIVEGDKIIFDHFFPHWILDTVFIMASLWATVACVIGLLRFWKDMKQNSPIPEEGKKIGLIAGIFEACTEIATHSKFRECDAASARNLSHLLTFYGFMALLVTTTAVFFGIYAPMVISGFPELTKLPMPIYHPVKILGLVGAALFSSGLILMAIKRATNKEQAGVTNYFDLLFLGVMCMLALTGILTYLTRIAGLVQVACGIYFVHLVFVFFLIAYLPYSKFGHIIYRTAAITYAKMTGRYK